MNENKNEYVILYVQNLITGQYEYEEFISGMYNTYEDDFGDNFYCMIEDDYSRIHRIYIFDILVCTETVIKELVKKKNNKEIIDIENTKNVFYKYKLVKKIEE